MEENVRPFMVAIKNTLNNMFIKNLNDDENVMMKM